MADPFFMPENSFCDIL